jgi:hypothetical protein
MRLVSPAGAALIVFAASPAFADPRATDTPAATASAMPGMDMSHGMAGMDMSAMVSGLGAYPMTRDGSGTSWQPDASRHDGLRWNPGGWMVMAHALFNGVYDSQSGPRGTDKRFISGMVMVEGVKSVAPEDTLTLKTMLSPDPFMGPDGYPLLLQTGETANGKTALIDRQHPHDLFMELAGALSHRFDSKKSVFVYLGLPGEPAFGPPAFMHRMSAMDSPEAPITHHWLDSTHITYGVVTAGLVDGAWKIEASSFRGREPDQRRFNFEPPKLDSEAARVSWNPGPNWSLQASWAHLTSPEQLNPLVNEDRLSASVIYTRAVGASGWWSTTAAYGSKRLSGEPGVSGLTLNGWMLETAFKPNDPWTLFARAESVQNNELLSLRGGATPVETVGKLSLGAIHDWRAASHVKLGLGGLYDFDVVPAALRASYGDNPHGAMAFVRLKID